MGFHNIKLRDSYDKDEIKASRKRLKKGRKLYSV